MALNRPCWTPNDIKIAINKEVNKINKDATSTNQLAGTVHKTKPEVRMEVTSD